MARISRTDLSKLLNGIAEALDLSDTLFETAQQKYQAVGTWLGGSNSPLADYSPQIYPQGSFQLGTVTKRPSDEYDLDFVFELTLSKGKVTQEGLKNMVGDRLKAHEIYRKLLDKEGRRCWTLNYAESAQFHMDILPAVPDHATHLILEAQGVLPDLARTSIAITDRTRSNYSQVDPDWPRCNPKGYAKWFQQQMIVRYKELQMQYAETHKAQVQDVPDYRIKTPLQRCVQLLKRHRDIRFLDRPKIKPASIILTTLSAYAYNNEADLTETLTNVLNRMPNFITVKNGVAWVTNPVDPSENFADRWKDNPERAPAFITWFKQVESEVNGLLACDDIDELRKHLTIMFGETVADDAVKRYQETTLGGISTGVVAVNKNRPVVTIRDPMKPWGW